MKIKQIVFIVKANDYDLNGAPIMGVFDTVEKAEEFIFSYNRLQSSWGLLDYEEWMVV